MTRERIITTLPNGGVAVTCPAEGAILCLQHGTTGPWHPWFGRPWWFAHVQWARMVRRGVKAKAAWRYCQTMMTGGASRREAIEIIAGRDCGHLGTALEIVDVSELPDDRTYRDAWRRSQNGGPVWIDEKAQAAIEEERTWRAYERA